MESELRSEIAGYSYHSITSSNVVKNKLCFSKKPDLTKKSPLSFCRKNEKQIFLRLNWKSFSRNKSTTAHTKEKISNCKKQISQKIFRFQLHLSLILECQTDIRKNLCNVTKRKFLIYWKLFLRLKMLFFFSTLMRLLSRLLRQVCKFSMGLNARSHKPTCGLWMCLLWCSVFLS